MHGREKGGTGTPNERGWVDAMGPNSLEKKLLDPRQLAAYRSPTGEVVRVKAEIGWTKLAPQEAATTLSSKELLEMAKMSPESKGSGGGTDHLPSGNIHGHGHRTMPSPHGKMDADLAAFQFGEMQQAAQSIGVAAAKESQPASTYKLVNRHRRNWRKTRRRRADEETDSSESDSDDPDDTESLHSSHTTPSRRSTHSGRGGSGGGDQLETAAAAIGAAAGARQRTVALPRFTGRGPT